jgi:hypothetical protein
MDGLTLDKLAKWHAIQFRIVLDRGRGADRATRSKCVKEATFHGDAVMLLERTIRES